MSGPHQFRLGRSPLEGPSGPILAHEQEEAISFGPLYERADVSC